MKSRVIVAGSLNMDLVTTSDRHPKIGETIMGSGFATYSGGKGLNQAVAAANMGVDTLMVGCIGNDKFGKELLDVLQKYGVDSHQVTQKETPSGVAMIHVASGDNTIVVVPGANHMCGTDDLDLRILTPHDVLLMQLEIPEETVQTLSQNAKAVGATTILNAAPMIQLSKDLLDYTDHLIINETELSQLTGEKLKDVRQQAKEFKKTFKGVLVVTLGADGVLYIENEVAKHVPGHKVTVVDTTGAGDCFCGVFASEIANNRPLHEAITRANQAASLSVQKMGASPSMPTKKDLA